MQSDFTIYKGLQTPLVFHYFKGKFIYYGVGSILAGLLSCMIISSLINIGFGMLTLLLIIGAGLSYTSVRQKKGLEVKTSSKGIVVIAHL